MADSTKTQGTEAQPQHATEELRPERLGAELRPERLGGQLRPERLGEPLKAERIQGMLAELPGWTAADDGQALTRTYLFPTIRASVAFVALAAEVGEANGYVPDIHLRHLEVTLRVATSEGLGITELDFQAARAIEPAG